MITSRILHLWSIIFLLSLCRWEAWRIITFTSQWTLQFWGQWVWRDAEQWSRHIIVSNCSWLLFATEFSNLFLGLFIQCIQLIMLVFQGCELQVIKQELCKKDILVPLMLQYWNGSVYSKALSDKAKSFQNYYYKHAYVCEIKQLKIKQTCK